MGISRPFVLALALSCCLLGELRADPLRLVPPQTDWVVRVKDPRRLIEALYQHDAVQKWYALDGVREYFDTTNLRRLQQLIAHFEKSLGTSGNDLVKRLTSGGVIVAGRFASPPNVLLIVQGSDEKLLERFVKLTVSIVENELARQESRDNVTPTTFNNVPGYRVGKACIATVGPTLFIAGDPVSLKTAVDLAHEKSRGFVDDSSFQAAGPSLSADALGSAWLNLESARKIPTFKAGLDALGLDVNVQILFGGLVQMLQRAKFLAVNLDRQGMNLGLEVRMPAGRQDLEARSPIYTPADDQGSLPILQPPRVLAAFSYYFDLKGFWDERGKLFDKRQVKAIEAFDANSGRYLGGTKLSTLLAQAGPRQRLVVAQPSKSPYSIRPAQAFPAFALVDEMRDPAFAKSMNTVLRSAGILAAFTYNVKLVEEKCGEHQLVSYYFPEDKKVPGDDKNVRFNFSPTFVTVRDQLIISSTAELARDLVALLDKETSRAVSPSSTRIALSARGGAQLLRDNRESLVAQTILNQALPPTAARKQLDAVIDLVDQLGELRFDIRYEPKEFRYSIRWHYAE